MNRFSGLIGFELEGINNDGIYEQGYEERVYHGDIKNLHTRFSPAAKVNDNMTFSAQISILHDSFILSHLDKIRYVVLQNSKWRVESITVERPRVVLNLGGLFNNG